MGTMAGPMEPADSYIIAMAMRKSAKFYYVGKNGPMELLKRLVLRSTDARMALGLSSLLYCSKIITRGKLFKV